ncbi:MAG: PAS domain S-box protein [Gemmatimonadales bacterium]
MPSVADSLVLAMEVIGDGVFLLDAEWRFRYLNRAAEKILSQSRDHLIGRQIWEEFPHSVGSTSYQAYQRAMAEGITVEFTVYYERLGVWFSVRATPVDRGLAVTFREVNDTVHWERLFHLSLDGIILAGLDGYFKLVNPAFCATLGRKAEDLTSRPWEDFVHPDDLSRTKLERASLGSGVPTIQFENRLQHADGSWRWIAWSVSPAVDEGLLYCVAVDVTDRRRQEELDRRHQRILRDLATGVPLSDVLDQVVRRLEFAMPETRCSILLLTSDGRHLRHGASPSLPLAFVTAIDGAEIGERVGSCGTAAARGQTVIVADIATDPLWQAYRDVALEHGLLACWSIPFRSARGAVLGTFAVYYGEIRTPSAVELDQAQEMAGLAAIAVERRATEDELRLLQTAINNLNDSVMITEAEPIDAPGPMIRFVNPAFERMTGWSPSEVIGRSPRFLQGPHTDRATLDRIRTALASWKPIRVELCNYARDGREFWIELDISPVTDDTGWYTHWVAVERDISERKALEAQLLQSQKMEAVGRLAGGIAHDFNNMLTAIHGFAELLALDVTDPRPAQHIQEIQRASARSSELTRKLLAFSRRQVLQPTIINLSHLVDGMAMMVGRLVGEHIDQRVRLATEPVLTLADPNQIEQVLLNLVLNARDAMPGGGRLTIETGLITIDATSAEAHEGLELGDFAMLVVSDTGSGMTADVRDRIFEPFFTTKSESGGTGLGLATTFGIVKQSGGQIHVYSEPGIGTAMKVFLPVAIASALPQQPAERPAVRLEGQGTVLVVEDEQLVRSLIARTLQRAGYQVLTADGRAEAEVLARDHSGSIDVLLTDVVLPQANGRKVAEAVTRFRPGIPVVYMSGYTEDAIVHQGVLDPGITFLEKPFTRDELLQRVASVLPG